MSTEKSTLVLLISALALTGCFDSSSDSDSDSGAGPGNGNDNGNGNGNGSTDAMVVDARSHDEPVYLDMASGELLEMNAEEAESSEEWHLAFRRHYVQLNGGESGPGNVAGAIGAEQSHFYTESGEPDSNVFLNADRDSERPVYEGSFDAPEEWFVDEHRSHFGDEWYEYNFVNGNMEADDSVGWLFRAANGETYGRLRMTDLDFPTREGNGVQDFEFSLDRQPAGASQFTNADPLIFEGSIPAEGGSACYDLVSESTVSCDGDDWDLRFGFEGRDIFLVSNSGVSGSGDGGVFGPFDWSELSQYSSATTSPEGDSLARHYEADFAAGLFHEYDWYAYSLEGQHQLWPNYRVYLIDSDEEDADSPRYALQIIGYYGDNGDSGQPVIRWRELSDADIEN